MATRFLKILSNDNKILKYKLMTVPSYTKIFNFSFLFSIEGDADLYVSDNTIEHPTFELEEHSMSSWTCGVDTILIPTNFGRPINIGVYGHPRFDLRLQETTGF